LLDVYGSVDKFGKRTGNDIISNKKTFLLTTAQAIADKENKELLYYWLQQNDKDSEKIKEVKNIYNRLNIKEVTEQRIEDLYKQAMAYLEQVNVSPDRKSGLVDFAKSLKVRNH
ncbi:MAG: polyprenyl synthetase family protein, partial [Bacteroidales bacterium]|nr:polyprenyl synthetase family protein [Bacteroidales bacterium]